MAAIRGRGCKSKTEALFRTHHRRQQPGKHGCADRVRVGGENTKKKIDIGERSQSAKRQKSTVRQDLYRPQRRASRLVRVSEPSASDEVTGGDTRQRVSHGTWHRAEYNPGPIRSLRRFDMKLGGPLLLLAIVFGLAALSAQTPLSDTLDIYWIDVEGGAATLVVTPRQESVLMDAGWGRPDDRDARRIEAAMRDANIDRIDYFIASHFHGDHTGGLPALAERVEIGQFLDYGETVEPDSDNSSQAFAAYLRAAEGNRRTVSPGDRLRLDGVIFTFVTAGGEIPSRASSVAGPNVFCDDADPGASDGGDR